MTYDPIDTNDDGVVDADVDNQSVNTEELNNAHYASAQDGPTGGEKINNAILAATSESGANTVVISGGGPDDVSANTNAIGSSDFSKNAWKIQSPIELPSDTTLILKSCYIFLSNGSDTNILRNVEATDTLGGTGNSNVNIKVRGNNAILDGNNTNQTTFDRETSDSHLNLGVRFLRVNGLTIDGLTIRNTNGWGIKPELCDDVSISDIKVDQNDLTPNMDGVHPTGCTDVNISNVRGQSGDDLIAINANDTDNFSEVGGPCHNINIYGITGDSGGHNIIRLYGNNNDTPTYDVSDINISNVTGRGDNQYIVRVGPSEDQSAMTDINIGNVTAESSGVGVGLLGRSRKVNINNVTTNGGDGVVTTRRQDNLTISNISTYGSDSAVSIGGTTFQTTISNITATQFSSAVKFAGGSNKRTSVSQVSGFSNLSGATLISIGNVNSDYTLTFTDLSAGSVDTIMSATAGVSYSIDDIEVNGADVFGTIGQPKVGGGLPPLNIQALPNVEGSMAWNDGTSGTAGPAFNDGSGWTSLVDGSTL